MDSDVQQSLSFHSHRQSTMHKQSTTNEVHQIMKENTYITINTKQISKESVCRKRIFWIVVPCGWVIRSSSFEETCCFLLQGYESIHRLLTLEVKRYIPSKRRDEITQPHGATTHNTSFLIRKQDLQRIKSFSSGLRRFQCVKRKLCRYTRRISNCNIIFSLCHL
jgi:hypothetical protein